jgi:uncharacterized protein (TIGR01777 family)
MRVFVTGASGFLGSALTAALAARGDQVVALSRSARDGAAGVAWVTGDPTVPGDWGDRIAGCDAVVHLAGEPVAARRWSEAQRRKILESRVLGTRAVAAAIAAAPPDRRPRVLVAANGVDWYAFDDGDTAYTEDRPRGQGFLQDVCAAWQKEAEGAGPQVRVAVMRTGIVLGKGEGALARMMTPFKLFFGGPMGNGRQWFPWVLLDDVVGAYLHALDRETVGGPVNLVAPGIVRQKAFARALGRALHRPSWAPVPGFALRLMVGGLADYLLHGRRVVPSVLERTGYAFRWPSLDEAIATVV